MPPALEGVRKPLLRAARQQRQEQRRAVERRIELRDARRAWARQSPYFDTPKPRELLRWYRNL